MEKQIIKKQKVRFKKLISNKFIWLFSISLVFILGSCEMDHHGYNGRPGDAYLSLSWEAAEPDYLDVGTSAIPPIFHWDEYYRAFPGIYLLYYEGSIWNGHRWISYAWEMEYDIWEVQGEHGGYHYDGADGPDSYFTLVCSPYGPYVYDEYVYYKKGIDSVDVSEKFENIENTGEVSKTVKGFGIKIKYNKVEPRNITK